MDMKKEELRYLQRLAEIYPTIGKASTEIINLQSILGSIRLFPMYCEMVPVQ